MGENFENENEKAYFEQKVKDLGIGCIFLTHEKNLP